MRRRAPWNEMLERVGTMIDAVLFDLDGTLFDRTTTVTEVVRQQHARYAELHHISAMRYVARFLELDAHGYIPKDIVYRTLVGEVGAPAALADLLFQDFRARYHDACVPIAGMRETLDALRREGYRLGVVTNGGDAFQRRTVAALGIADLLGVVLTSEGEAIQKPDPAIFHRACAALAVAPGATVFVGDHPAVDVDGAAGAGLRAVWLHNSFWDPPRCADAVIDQLAALPALLSRLSAARQ